MKIKNAIFLSLIPVMLLPLIMHGFIEYKVVSHIFFEKDRAFNTRDRNPHKPEKVMIGSSIVKSVANQYPETFYNYGVGGCGHIIGERYFLTRHAFDNTDANVYYISMNEHFGDGIFTQINIYQQDTDGSVSCKVITDKLANKYIVPEYQSVNFFTFYTYTMNGHREKYQALISRYVFSFLHGFFRPLDSVKDDQASDPANEVHHLADKYIRQSIDFLRERNKKIILIRLPQGDKKIQTESLRVLPLEGYMAQLQEDYNNEIYVLD